MKTAIILGATGLTGSVVLDQLLQDERYAKIKLFSRSTAGKSHEKIEEHLVDLFRLEDYVNEFTGDDIYCCLGTTQAKTPDKDMYRSIDYGIPLAAARLAKKNRIPNFMVISALGADPEGKFFYNRVKGEMERDVLALNIPNTYIFQPSLISGKRKEKRPFENAWKQMMKLGNFFLIGSLKKFRSIHPVTIAKAMIYVANNRYSSRRIASNEIKEIANSYR